MKTLIPSIIIIVIGITIAYFMISKPKPLKIYNPADINPKLVDESLQGTTKNHSVGDFSLTDQDGRNVTPKDFEDKIYITDFFFVTCPTICPKMTDQMLRVYEEFKENGDILFLSHTVMPEEDSVPVLKEYADKNNISSERWKLVTGDKKHIYDLARKTYFAAVTEGDGGKDDFIHTENFILVDKEKRLRGFYDGTSKKDVDRLIKDIYTLLAEYEK
ncbi:MAG: SCO family protein [Flavobacteriales bacterium]|nr:SCO family protein [Flavobacteriales bacterium]MCW8912270.1 SCO family protein [Flavobacteriales bacterium]MCW8937491.1 SCO family protein [Flavobacteriales bacterium]MCW8940782.1 SCO family protein [Flavobacteriales bacterium]MCW8967184.1 SCO family protein [Flavobacteriales bacterium]